MLSTQRCAYNKVSQLHTIKFEPLDYVKHNPKNQIPLYFLGASRPATSKDRLLMPYTDAVLLEVLRKTNIVPTALPHLVDENIKIDGQVQYPV